MSANALPTSSHARHSIGLPRNSTSSARDDIKATSSHARHSIGLPRNSTSSTRDDIKATRLYCEESQRSSGRHALWNEGHTIRLYCEESQRSSGRHALRNEGHTDIRDSEAARGQSLEPLTCNGRPHYVFLESTKMAKTKRRNFKRDRERLDRFLTSKCIICYTRGEIPSRKLSCCGKQIHESCLQKCFHHQTSNEPRCPHCRQYLYPFNQGEAAPTPIPEGAIVFQFELQTFAPRSPEEIADELWDYLPFLVPPTGWAEYRRSQVMH